MGFPETLVQRYFVLSIDFWPLNVYLEAVDPESAKAELDSMFAERVFLPQYSAIDAEAGMIAAGMTLKEAQQHLTDAGFTVVSDFGLTDAGRWQAWSPPALPEDADEVA